MKYIILLTALTGLMLSTGCHAHKADKVVVVKKNNHTKKVILIDDNHTRKDYRIVYSKPKKKSVCKKHKKHWHCT